MRRNARIVRTGISLKMLRSFLIVAIAAVCFSLIADAISLSGWLRLVAVLIIGALLVAVLLPRSFPRLSSRQGVQTSPLRIRAARAYYFDPYTVTLDDLSVTRTPRPFRRGRRLNLSRPSRLSFYDVHPGAPFVTTHGFAVSSFDRPYTADAVLRSRLFRYWWLRAPATTGDQPTFDATSALHPVSVIPVQTSSARRRAETFSGALQPIGVKIRIVDVTQKQAVLESND